jgi:coenzyme F420-reducing hydrogenase gamma subunit
MRIGIFQFNGCDKCFAESMLLGGGHEVERVTTPSSWKGGKLDVAVITGYLLPKDKPALDKIASSTAKFVAYGNCATTGGVFGLAYQRGNDIHPLCTLVSKDVLNVDGCLGEVEELEAALWGKVPDGKAKLCETCTRHSTCQYLDDVVRQLEIETGDDVCFNNKGFLCSGYIARSCKEFCVGSGTPCRGCKPSIKDPSFRMLGMFATLMANVEVATEATGKGGTDKLADAPDALTRSVPDVSGSLFRFSLPASRLPVGKVPSTKNILSDVFVGRPIEELPLIAGLLGGLKSISFILDVVEAYENGAELAVSETTKTIRTELRLLEKDLQGAATKGDKEAYKATCAAIRKIAGNMNLSNVFFGGFKVPIKDHDNVDPYKAHVFEVKAGRYASGRVAYEIDANGMVTVFTRKEA